MRRIGIGIIGCGNISGAYLTAARRFPILDVRALADLDMNVARARSEEFSVPALEVAALLADAAIEIVVNLTTPPAHVPVGLQVLAAGKHVHSEKPLGVTLAEGQQLVQRGRELKLRVGCAPDTFLSGAQQTCRKLIDDGAIGRVVAGSAVFMCPGHERWHPNPAFYYGPGAGPMLDMGPYYITTLVNLLGPVVSVAGAVATPRKQREILSEPRKGQLVDVQVPTHVAGLLTFANGAVVSIVMSFDVPRHRHLPIELYGTDGAMIVPDPNRFGGQIEVARGTGEFKPEETLHAYANGNFRIVGVADMAQAIVDDRPHRASGDLALHVLEVMLAVQEAGASGRSVAITTRPERPAMLAIEQSGGSLN
ncbi:MAG TPA: Gfo/Idh/MocA family oxidoreductase [Burkholderiaceae bacterium]|nr:Gfo/Idh/MocA family oxidoreductase [Burkholderiaceae bacterium]